MAAPPDALLVASPGGAIEPVVDAPALEYERAHSRPLARIGGHVGSAHGRECRWPVGCRRRGYRVDRPLGAARLTRHSGPVVVFVGSVALLLLGNRDVE